MTGSNYLSKLKSPTIEKEERKKAFINEHIKSIDEALENRDIEECRALQLELDGIYQAAIKNWGYSLLGYSQNKGFVYYSTGLSEESVFQNLKVMKAKLIAFREGFNTIEIESGLVQSTDIRIDLQNKVNIELTFEDVRRNINEIGTLSQSETDELIEKVNMLEKISLSSDPRKTKWEKIKPIVINLLDKGVDIVIQILPIILQMFV